MKKNSHLSIVQGNNPWSHNNNTIWLASTIMLNRNIDKYKFPGKISTDVKKQIVSLIKKQITSSTLLHNPIVVEAENLTPLEKDFLAEQFLNEKGLQHVHAGEGFIIDEPGEILISVNLEDHLQFEVLRTDDKLEDALNRLQKIETTLGKSITYSFSPRFGFLTSRYHQCGTGLSVNIFLQPSALIHTNKIDEILTKYADESVAIMGIHGDPSEIIGDIIVMRNAHSLGLTEEDIISSLEVITTKIVVEEKSLRSKLKLHPDVDLIDRISRAYGILVHSYQIDAIEALNALSLIKLGCDLGLVTGITMEQLNLLLFNSRRAHLLSELKEDVSQDQVLHKRAEYIHEKFKTVKLHIPE